MYTVSPVLHTVVTTVVVPLLLSYSVSVKGVFSPAPPYCGYLKPSHSFVIMINSASQHQTSNVRLIHLT